MVHCKQARRRPKGAADARKNRERAPGGPLPGYMRPTSSSGARAGRESATAAPPPERESAAPCPRTPTAARATCSSALRSALARGGGEGRACRYAYCSLKGHAHAPVAPPLGTFVAARRRLIKTEQRMKHRGVSAFRNTKTNNAAGLGGHGLFVVQVYPNAATSARAASSGSSCSGLSAEEMEAAVAFGRREAQGKWGGPDGSVDGSCGSSDVISDGFAEPAATVTARSRRPKDAIDGDGDAWGRQDQEAEDSGGCCRSDISEELGATYQDHGSGVTSVESSMDDISSAFGGMCFEDAGSDPTDGQRNKLTMSTRGTAPRDEERIRPFNPRAPNFLQVEPDADAEKVDLRHQEADDRKNAEEWMVDYALRRTVNKLARAQKRKVEMLVQAFEAVLPPVPGEKNAVQQDGDKKGFAQARARQAFS
ncbi:calmodulin binding protein PICBP-like [Lolium rigidum]|uniref:calmodulin binding protein PICBP-like n=1 Tax=Lolium rigidum TaxID=89674 RepID=UPI001F5D8D09|nr:calmodulin binding protein PICBP-like [Lolium rigidum]